MIGRGWVALGAFLCALAVTAAAFGAHGLESRLDERGLDLWELAARYLLYGGFGTLAAGILAHLRAPRSFTVAAGSLAVGTGIFSGTLFALALGGPRVLGAVTPVGGLLLILGFLLLAWQAGRR